MMRPLHLPQDVEALAIIIDKSGSQLKTGNNEAELSLFHVADVVTRAVGVQPLHPEFAPKFMKTDAFTKVKANVMIAVESLGEGVLGYCVSILVVSCLISAAAKM